MVMGKIGLEELQPWKAHVNKQVSGGDGGEEKNEIDDVDSHRETASQGRDGSWPGELDGEVQDVRCDAGISFSGIDEVEQATNRTDMGHILHVQCQRYSGGHAHSN